MLSADMKKRLRHVALAGCIASFVLLYVGAVTLASEPVIIAALVLTAFVCLAAALAF